MARPSAFNCAMMRKRSSISLRDRAAVGSSMMMTEASWLSARVISTMCFWATESCFSLCVGIKIGVDAFQEFGRAAGASAASRRSPTA